MAIYTRCGSKVERINGKTRDERGNTWAVCKLAGMDGEDREIFLGDLRADGGIKEIDAVIAMVAPAEPVPVALPVAGELSPIGGYPMPADFACNDHDGLS